jgi:hypothetical protein
MEKVKAVLQQLGLEKLYEEAFECKFVLKIEINNYILQFS